MTRRDLLARSLRAGAAVAAAPMLNLGRCRLYAGAPHEYSVRAVDVVGRSLVIDMLGLLSLDWKKVSAWHRHPASFSGGDREAMRASGIDVFHPAVDLNLNDARTATERWLRNWNNFLVAQSNFFQPVLQCADLASAKQQNKIGVLLGMQNSDHFRTPDDVSRFYALGQRLSQLTYNSRNRIGYGCAEANDNGVTELGFQVIERMNLSGMIIDVSHAGEQTCLDTFAGSTKPVLVTHSNCRALVPHPRCKSDEVIAAMAKTGGVMGITGIRAFVSRRHNPDVSDVLDHFDHVVKVSGIEHVGVGSDTDLGGRDAGLRRRGVRTGVDVPGLNHALRIFELADGLIKRGYTDRHVELILGGNFQRAIDHIFCPPVPPAA
jgi:membrane dipeptidase